MPRRVRISGRIGRMANAKLYNVSGTAPESFGNLRLSPKFDISVHGSVAVNKIFRRIYSNAESETKRAMDKAARLLVREVKKNLISGDLRAYDTGKLYRSIAYQIEKSTLNAISMTVGSYDVEYAIYVHEGTSKMPSRPFLSRTFQMNEKKIIDIIRDGLNKDVEKGII